MFDSIVGIDFDNTIVRPFVNFWDAAALKLKMSVLHAPSRYGINEYNSTVRKEIYGLFNNPVYMCDLCVLPFTKFFIEWLHKRRNKVYIVSARHPIVRAQTSIFIYKEFGINTIVYCDIGKSKGEIFKQYRFNFWIDDNENDVDVAIKLGIQTFHIINTPWGSNVVQGAQRVKGVYNIIDQFACEKLYGGA